jgi:hypothetical protein
MKSFSGRQGVAGSCVRKGAALLILKLTRLVFLCACCWQAMTSTAGEVPRTCFHGSFGHESKLYQSLTEMCAEFHLSQEFQRFEHMCYDTPSSNGQFLAEMWTDFDSTAKSESVLF